jgi:RecB family exonuclease
LTPLPPFIVEVTVPDCFSPSALGSSGDCKLKLVIASLARREWRERLASGPEAAVGTLLHRVLERAGQGTTNSPEEIFREEYERATDEIRRDPHRAHFAELAATKSLAEWTRVKAWVLARAARENATSTSRGPRAGGARPALGTEVGLESRALRLRGKADRIRQLGPRMFEVRDFKTGTTLDERGEIKQEIAMQLQAYGLLLLERQRGAEVRLVVDDGEEREVPFDLDARRAAKEVLTGITGSMPPAGLASARELTSPGPSCWGCPIRHVCPAYRANAPGWWKQYPSNVDRLSNDVWGAALEVLGEGRVDLVLRDDAGRRVRIDGLDDRHGIAPSLVGKRIWFFGLEATGATRGFDGARFHPRSFHELPRDRLERRAWALHVFVETEVSR